MKKLLTVLILAFAVRTASAGYCTMQEQHACNTFCTGYEYANCSTSEEVTCWDHPTNPHVIQCGIRHMIACDCAGTTPAGGPNRPGADYAYTSEQGPSRVTIEYIPDADGGAE